MTDDDGNDGVLASLDTIPEAGQQAFSASLAGTDYVVIGVEEMDIANTVRYFTGRDVPHEEIELLRETAMAESAAWCIKIDPQQSGTPANHIIAYNGDDWTITAATEAERPLWEDACGQAW
ncbi:MAG: hypothetical protein ACOCX3_03725 [Chloroflexota bacterium]